MKRKPIYTVRLWDRINKYWIVKENTKMTLAKAEAIKDVVHVARSPEEAYEFVEKEYQIERDHSDGNLRALRRIVIIYTKEEA